MAISIEGKKIKLYDKKMPREKRTARQAEAGKESSFLFCKSHGYAAQRRKQDETWAFRSSSFI